MLEYKTLYGDLLVFKNNNDCMTIARGNNGLVELRSIEINGITIDKKDCDFDLFSHKSNTFTRDDFEFFKKEYPSLVEQ